SDTDDDDDDTQTDNELIVKNEPPKAAPTLVDPIAFPKTGTENAVPLVTGLVLLGAGMIVGRIRK
ncbi:MAG: LPXTG cell wall anchor domain-containing protein, partial [Syntrophomonadaceae bacterium]